MRIVVFISLIFSLSLVFTAQATPLSAEAYGKLPTVSLMVISPSGERLAYRSTSGGRDMAVILNMSDKSLVGAVDISAVKPNSIYFIDEDRLIFSTSQNMKIRGYKGRHNVSAAMAYNVKTKKVHQLLTPGRVIYKGQSAVGKILGISGDKKYAYMPAYGNATQLNLYRAKLNKRSNPRLVQKGSNDTIDFFMVDDEVVARERFNNKKNLHLIEARIDGDWKEIFREETDIMHVSFSGLTPDKTKLVMLRQDDDHGRWAYYTMALTDGKIAGPIFSREDKDIETVLTDINRIVHGVKYSGFTPSYEFFDNKLNARMNGISKVLPDNNFTISDYSADWNKIVFYMDGKQSSGDFVLYNNGALDMLSAAREEVPPSAVNQVIEYTFKARDGMEIPSLLTIPNGKELKDLPAIMMPHGGPESYDTKSFGYLAQYFSSQGYVVIQPQFRGSKGFGPNHLLAGRGEWGRKMQDDLTDALLGLAESGKIDRSRVCIVGASYGGYAALAGAVFTPDLYKCVVSINGVSDLEEMLETEERDYGDDHWVVAYWQKLIAGGNVDEDHLEKISPINHVKNISAPVLLIHGTYDKVVPISQSEDMLDELEDAKKDVTFLQLRKGDHHLSNAKNRMQAMLAIEEFVKKHI